MKKLMIAAAVAAMGAGVFAECAEDPTPAPCAFAYKMTLSGKTIASKSIKTKGVVDGTSCIETGVVCMAVPSSFKSTIYVIGEGNATGGADTCDEGCGCNDFSATQGYVVDKKAKMLVPATVSFDQIDVIGTKLNQVQASGTIQLEDGMLTLAGQGKIKKGKLSSVKGNFVGVGVAPVCKSCQYDPVTCDDICDDTVAQVGKLCEPGLADAATAALYGKWSMKASKAMAKKLAKNFDPHVLAKGYTTVE